MRNWNVYKNNDNNEYEAIKIGFCWPGFLAFVMLPVIGLFWCGVNKLWKHLFISFFIILPFNGLLRYVSPALVVVVLVSMAFIFGVGGNEMKEKKLQSLGYKLINKFSANSKQEAINMAKCH